MDIRLRHVSLTYGRKLRIGKAALAFFFLGAIPAAAEQTVILALGDSLTQGYGLIEQEGFVPQMRNYLAEKGADVRMINAGVSGDTTAGGAARIEWSLTPDIDAVMVALGGNDLLRGIDPDVSRMNLENILKVAQSKDLEILLVGMSAPGNYGADYKERFDRIYPELSKTYGTLIAPNFFEGLGADGAVDPAAVQKDMQDDGIHPNASGVRKVVGGLGPYVMQLIADVQTSKSLENN